MTQKYKVVLEYNGSSYLGWQSQRDSGPTVQDIFNRAVQIIFKDESISSMGAGRTDSGVHSLNQHVVFSAPFFIEFEKLQRAINSHLPKEVRVFEVTEASDNLRITSDASSREYRYLFTAEKLERAFQKNMIANYPFDLDLEKMKRAASLFLGKHDFIRFSCVGSEPSSTVREIYSCEILHNQTNMHGIMPDHFYLKVEGSGFLKQMIRLMMGTIWLAGRGKVSEEDIQKALTGQGKGHLAPVAPACGLYKISVKYPKEALTIN